MKIMLPVFILLSLIPAAARARDQALPVEISADKTLEWHRENRQYVAHGNALVKKGDTTIRADDMAADYRDGQSSGTDIYRLTATGHVTIEDKGSTASGDKAVYDLDSGLAVMTGADLKMTSPGQTVMARERFEYHVKNGQVKAIGNAKVVRDNDTLSGDILTAILGSDAQGNQVLERLDAAGNVRIVTPTETLAGERGAYNAKTQSAVITGNVTITRGENVLTGQRAEVDLKTNVSRLFGSSIEDGQTGGRVKGVFYPGGEKKAETQ